MGLSGRKTKQRIGADPRNLSWADDAARFGQAYLEKFGWSNSDGLGAAKDGMKSHIKVHHKLDMMGIGAMHSKDKDGIAWKQNKDFERLLARLNSGGETPAEELPKVEGFVRQGEDTTVEVTDSAEEGSVKEESGKKRRRSKDLGGEGEESKKEKKKRRKVEKEGKELPQEDKAERKRRKEEKREKRSNKLCGEESESALPSPPAPAAGSPRAVAPRPIAHRAHRARFLASKRLANLSESAMAEILGVAPTPSSAATPTSGSLTPLDAAPTPDPTDALEKLTTSTKSIADYFKDKLGSTPSSAAPASANEDGDDHRPARAGFGFTSRSSFATSANTTVPSAAGFGAMKFRFAEMFAPTSSINPSPAESEAAPAATAAPLSSDFSGLTPVKGKNKNGDKDSDRQELSKEERKKRKKDMKEAMWQSLSQSDPSPQDQDGLADKPEKRKKKKKEVS